MVWKLFIENFYLTVGSISPRYICLSLPHDPMMGSFGWRAVSLTHPECPGSCTCIKRQMWTHGLLHSCPQYPISEAKTKLRSSLWNEVSITFRLPYREAIPCTEFFVRWCPRCTPCGLHFLMLPFDHLGTNCTSRDSFQSYADGQWIFSHIDSALTTFQSAQPLAPPHDLSPTQEFATS